MAWVGVCLVLSRVDSTEVGLAWLGLASRWLGLTWLGVYLAWVDPALVFDGRYTAMVWTSKTGLVIFCFILLVVPVSRHVHLAACICRTHFPTLPSPSYLLGFLAR